VNGHLGTKRAARWAGGGLLALSLVPWAMAGTATASTATSGEIELKQSQVPTTAAAFNSHDCSNFDRSKGDGFHFVISAQNSFDSLTAVFDTGTVTVTVFGPPSDKHAYVYAPAGSVLTDAWADTTPNPTDKTQFVLSHTCVGETKTTTPVSSSPPVSTPPETTPVTTTPVTTTPVTTTPPVSTPPETTPPETTPVTTTPVTTTPPVSTPPETTPPETTPVTTTPVTTTPPETTPPETTPVTTTPVTTTPVTTTPPETTPPETITTTTAPETVPTTASVSPSVLGTKTGLPQTGSGLPVVRALALSLALMLAGLALLALPGQVGLEIKRRH
jgi:hypothetical protein